MNNAEIVVFKLSNCKKNFEEHRFNKSCYQKIKQENTPEENSGCFISILEMEIGITTNIKNASLGIEELKHYKEHPFKVEISSDFGDVINRDHSILKRDLNNLSQLDIYVFAFMLNGTYSGHIYAWSIENCTNVIGIRMSVHQYILSLEGKQETRGMSYKLIKKIEEWSKSKYIRVLRPIGKMPENLTKMGFVLNPPELKILRTHESLTKIEDFPLLLGISYLGKFYEKIEKDYFKVK